MNDNAKNANYSVLVVDDNVLLRNIVADMLRNLGFNVTEAEDGHQAFKLFQANRFHIIVTDWVMPIMTGLELCQAVRADTAHLASAGYTYIIMLTSQDSKNDTIAGLEAGADEYLIKPVHKPELQARIRTAMRIIDLEAIRQAHYEQVEAASLVDVLTGVHNRKFMEERLPLEIKRANRYQRPLSVMLIGFNEIDAFRKEHGIFATEKMLQATAALLKESVRQEVDWVARWNEYQFLVLLPETEVSDASTVAKRLKLRLNQQEVVIGEQGYKFSALFGIVGFIGNQGKKDVSIEMMLEYAQKALKKADAESQIGGIKLS
ncbi:GGDEF domain-containing response regulator [Geomesophilobacter sediminis]|uniref:Response regulator n=1 Tax=Geomesophilobacter sediminis TaxID=2798584 RepID=A0A8J7JL72_9BACT|nr:response regulator [Geomesophilobacter sediminis]MBJ6724565.1 response regulator [Geomesophilobacter sediminis]